MRIEPPEVRKSRITGITSNKSGDLGTISVASRASHLSTGPPNLRLQLVIRQIDRYIYIYIDQMDGQMETTDRPDRYLTYMRNALYKINTFKH